ncbi:MAG TPA: polymer-forming cytoskeletal protein [Casimicrobiaceae bacterium]|nr:polymer-forming cytoskeletal protein [Casimicrobiaceae bacterium]
MPEPTAKDQKPVPRPNPLGANPTMPSSTFANNTPPRTSSPTPAPAADAAQSAGEAPKGSKLSIGPNINLKGVEISNCDVIVIEGNVDATINSKVMEIGEPGKLHGTAIIDIAEIHGDFSGELTARSKLVVHATGRVTGTVRYGKLVVAEGGTVTGELKQLDGSTTDSTQSSAGATGTTSTPSTRPLLNPQPH